MIDSALLEITRENLKEILSHLQNSRALSNNLISKANDLINDILRMLNPNITHWSIQRLSKAIADWISVVKEENITETEAERLLDQIQEHVIQMKELALDGPITTLARYLDRNLSPDDEKEIEPLLFKYLNRTKEMNSSELKLFLVVITSLNLLFSEEFRVKVVHKLFHSHMTVNLFICLFCFTTQEQVTDTINLELLSTLMRSSAIQKLFKVEKDIVLLIPGIKAVMENSVGSQSINFIESICIFIRDIFMTDSLLLQLFQVLDFKLCSASVHLRCLVNSYFKTLPPWYIFLPDVKKRRAFLYALQQSRKAYYFGVNIIVGDIPPQTLCSEISKYCLGKKDYALSISNLQTKDKSGRPLVVPYHNLFSNLLFFSLREYFKQASLNVRNLFVRIVFYLASPSDMHREATLITNPGFGIRIKLFVDQLNRLGNFGLTHKEDRISVYVLGQMKLKVKSLMGMDPVQAYKDMAVMIKHILTINLDYVKFIISCKRAIGKISSGNAAIQETLTAIFQKWDICDWDTINLKERVYYIYCYLKYTLSQFREWFDSMNVDNNWIVDKFKDLIFQQAVNYERHISGVDRIVKYGYKFMQNNQVVAILGAIQATKEKKHYFARLQTGQGKSLVLALLAVHFTINLKKRVAVFSCYDHLAARDYQQFQPLFDEYGIISAHVGSETSSLSADTQLIYANLSTLFVQFQDGIRKKARGSSYDLLNLQYDVVLLDEFDALILDARKITSTVYDFSDLYNLPKFDSIEETKELATRMLLDDPDLKTFLSRSSVYSLHNSMFNKFGQEPGHVGYDYLGNETNYIGGIWYELYQNQTFYLYASKLFLLPYILDVEFMVGFSGSINSKGISRVSELLDKKDEILRQLDPSSTSKKSAKKNDQLMFMDIPCFFGKDNLRNTKITESVRLGEDVWKRSIEQDILKACKMGQPVLIFADISDADEWRTLIEIVDRTKGSRELIFLTTSEDVTDTRRLRDCCDSSHICVASHIAARGIDFKVSEEYNTCGGMHVLITYNPMDVRLLTQMIGRTARMENQGNYSIILKDELPSDTDETLGLTQFQFEFNRYIVLMCQELSEINFKNPSRVWKRWILYMNYLIRTESWGPDLHGQTLRERIRRTMGLLVDDPDEADLRKFQSRADIPVHRPKGKHNSSCVVS